MRWVETCEKKFLEEKRKEGRKRRKKTKVLRKMRSSREGRKMGRRGRKVKRGTTREKNVLQLRARAGAANMAAF